MAGPHSPDEYFEKPRDQLKMMTPQGKVFNMQYQEISEQIENLISGNSGHANTEIPTYIKR